ncbi:sulfotransferase [Longimicrobium sp.]|jgi:hypothetical protein|uniref:sulfotransferase family protein n=1 Tax=Longimicrobium sp. TaxID=2029185 RepID=UPI002EDA722A
MRRPDFFVIGAPKCGTTSLARWLAENPGVYVSPVKEPFHFSTDLHRQVRTPAQYEALFAGAGEGHAAVGEATTWYLYSRTAVGEIERYSPGARYVVCLRNPVQMALSLYQHLVFTGREDAPDFQTAWSRQEARARGEGIPRSCEEPAFLQYGSVCALGEQLQRLYARVGRDRVLPILLDDMRDDPAREYRRVLAFLGAPDDGRSEFPVRNRAKHPRSLRVARVMRWGAAVRDRMGLPRGLGLGRLNVKSEGRVASDPATVHMLGRFFAAEVDLLRALLGRPLPEWTGSAEAAGPDAGSTQPVAISRVRP